MDRHRDSFKQRVVVLIHSRSSVRERKHLGVVLAYTGASTSHANNHYPILPCITPTPFFQYAPHARCRFQSFGAIGITIFYCVSLEFPFPLCEPPFLRRPWAGLVDSPSRKSSVTNWSQSNPGRRRLRGCAAHWTTVSSLPSLCVAVLRAQCKDGFSIL